MFKHIQRILCTGIAVLMIVLVCVPFQANALHADSKIQTMYLGDDVRTSVVADDTTEERIIDYVPLYDQSDYPEIPFSQGSVATSGCGITCVAMIASYFRDEFISPGDLGKYFNIPGQGNDRRMEAASNALGLPLQEKTWYWSKAYQALQNGQVVISLQKAGLFTDGGHFIVLTGINEDGKIMVNDPFGYNWTKSEEMIDGYAYGFTIEQITENDAAYWIYDKKPDQKVDYPQNWKTTAD